MIRLKRKVHIRETIASHWRGKAEVHIEVVGSGVVGLCAAWAFAQRGCRVTLVTASNGPDQDCASWYAGAMLAPDCEMERADACIRELAKPGLGFWRRVTPHAITCRGTLVLALPQHPAELRRFARLTDHWQAMDGNATRQLEADISERFAHSLYYPNEGHLEPRQALSSLWNTLAQQGVALRPARPIDPKRPLAKGVDWRVDCRGWSAKDSLPGLRGVKGEMVIVKTHELQLSRPLRLLHPRNPIYIVPRRDQHFMIGATSIESADNGCASVRSVLELLSTAMMIHPALSEASVVETGAGTRPAFADNCPRLWRQGRTLYVNGVYRHGFLIAPALAQRAANFLLDKIAYPEIIDENQSQRPPTTHPSRDSSRAARRNGAGAELDRHRH